jgi:hypothetical protein
MATTPARRYSAEELRRAVAEHREHARTGQYPPDLRVWARQSQVIAEQAARDAETLETIRHVVETRANESGFVNAEWLVNVLRDADA